MKDPLAKFSFVKYSLVIVSIAIIYFCAARLSLLLALGKTNASPVWPPSGIAFAATLMLGPRVWPGIALGAFLANFTTFFSYGLLTPITTVAVSLLISAGNTLESVVGAYLLRSLTKTYANPFDRVENVMKFAFVSVIICAIAATIGTTTEKIFGVIPFELYGLVWITWWLGDLSGVLVITPTILIWQSCFPQIQWHTTRFIKMLFYLAFLFLTSYLIFGRDLHFGLFHYPVAFLLIPFVIWAVFRFEQIVLGFSMLIVTSVAIWGTLQGTGPFIGNTQNESLLLLEGFIVTVGLTWLFLTAVIEEQREIERAMRQSEERTRLILETANDAFIGMDEHGQIVEWNRSAQNVFGWSREEVLGRLLAETIIPIQYREAHTSGMERFLKTHESKILNKRMEFIAIHRDGHEIMVELTVWPVRYKGTYHFNAFLRDITGRKEEEANRAYLAAIVESTHDCVLAKTLNGTITSWNKGAERMYGYQASEIIGKSVTALAPPDRATDAAQIIERIKRGERVDNYETVRLHKNGQRIHVSLTVSPLLNKEGALIGCSTIARDITRQKETEEKQARLMQEIESTNQELSNFAHVVSHDLKAPLRGISAIGEWLANDYGNVLDQKGKDWLKLLHERIQLAYALIDGILDYSSIGKRKVRLRNVDLNDLVQDVFDLIEAGENINFKIDTPLPTIYCDQIQIRQVFQNLLSNAIKYMDKPVGEIRVACVEDGEDWKFSVSDNGPGIDPRYYRKIFQMFQTLQPKDKSQSTGIGLPLAKKIVEMYGGTIWVESRLGQGSTFYFTFPRDTVLKMRDNEDAEADLDH